MIPFVQILLTTLEGLGEAFGRRQPKTSEQAERQRTLRRNERAVWFFVIFAVLFSLVLFLIMAFR